MRLGQILSEQFAVKVAVLLVRVRVLYVVVLTLLEPGPLNRSDRHKELSRHLGVC